ncbi:HNH endonuclease signature motif containing protein [Streptomyces sp. NPDC059740]|uniref:HNH endonuclease signature motif containing protein n=1 Tax=Streptomyces sp. NPDC059740 TaxID=3346926 RepID=UPI00364F51EC
MGESRFTYALLSEAAAHASSLTEALVHLGVDPTSPTRKYLRNRLRRLGVDTTHFQREGDRWTREVLEPAVAASTSMNGVLRRLGLPVVGGYHTHITRRVRAMGIDTSHFTGRAEHVPGVPRRRGPEAVLVAHGPERSRRARPSRLRTALLAHGVPERCADCGIGPAWRERPLPLEVDHIDGDWRNNLPSNLRFLCPNCHSATDTYRGRGKKRLGAQRASEQGSFGGGSDRR